MDLFRLISYKSNLLTESGKKFGLAPPTIGRPMHKFLGQSPVLLGKDALLCRQKYDLLFGRE